MSAGSRTRRIHRWVSAIFTLAVLANFATMPLENEALSMSVGALTLGPLAVLMATGVYLFVLPYLRRRAG